MARTQLQTVLGHLRKMAGPPGAERSDGQLLQCFAAGRDEAAFEALVRRHGPLVLGVCRSVLRHRQDAEDAFQATFLILARRAAAIRRPESLASWLYGVAYRTALKARSAAARRRATERPTDPHPQPDPASEAALRELQARLDEEVNRLPEKYRAPFVLCCLEGEGRADAARLLGWKEGTVCSRLAHARKLLQVRLARRGVLLSAALCAGAVCRAAVPAPLATATVRAALSYAAGNAAGTLSAPAVALAEGARTAVLMAKLKTGFALLLVLGLVTAAGLLARPAPSAKQPEPGAAGGEGRRDRTDRFGDPLPAGALARLGTTRWRHGQVVRALAFTPGGKAIASADYGSGVHLWDAATGRELRAFVGHQTSVSAVAVSPDGKLLASGAGNTVRLWDVATGKEIRRMKKERGLHMVQALVFTPDGKMLISGDGDRAITFRETATGKELRVLRGHTFEVACLALSPDGKTLASGSGSRVFRSGNDATIRLWDVASGKEVRRMNVQEGSTQAVAFSPDGKLLASGGADKLVHLWDAGTGKEVRRLTGHRKTVLALAFSPDGKAVASAGDDGDIRVWDVGTGKERWRSQGHPGGVSCLHFSPDGAVLASGGADHMIRLWHAGTGKERAPVSGHPDVVTSLAFSPDGRSLATACGDSRIRLWRPATGQELRVLAGHAPRESSFVLFSVVYSPDGKTLASVGQDNTLRLWDAANGKERLRAGGAAAAVAFSPDGRTVAAFGAGVSLWDARSGKKVRTFEQPPQRGPTSGSFVVYPGHEVLSLAFSPDGKLLASQEYFDRAVQLWDVASGKRLHRLEDPQGLFSSVAFSPDGRTLAAGGTAIHLWEAATGKERGRFGGDRMALAVALSPDGRTLASGEWDGTVRMWDLATEKERGALRGHRGLVRSLAFSPDGKTLASGSLDTTALIWDLGGLRLRGKTHEEDLSARELNRLWDELAAADGVKAYRAIRTLAGSPRSALGFLKEQVPVAAPLDERRRKEIAGWIADLESDRFADRKRAAAELEKLGELALPALRRVLAGKPSLEVRRRVDELVRKAEGAALTADRLRTLRALEALEHMRTPEARRRLEALAGGAGGALETREARAAVNRLRR